MNCEALGGDGWSRYMEQYIAYDLVGSPPQMRSSISKEALWQDCRTQLVETLVPESLAKIQCPVRFLRAERGTLNAEPLYAEGKLAKGASKIRNFSSRTLDGVNHFTILISERGAKAVAQEVRSMLNGPAK